MSDKKMIIRNCPCFNEGHPMLDYYGECLSLTDDTQVCQGCTDCVMKQIVEKCKYWINAEKNNKYKTNGWMLSDDILQLLDIQEVE